MEKTLEGIICLEVEEAQLSLKQSGFLTGGTAGYWLVQFSFSGKAWNGLTKTAVLTWRQGGEAKTLHLLLDYSERITIPPELLTEPGAIYVGIFGIGGKAIRLATNFIRLDVRAGSWSNHTPPEPLPDIYQQIIARLQEVSAGADAAVLLAEQMTKMANDRIDQAITASSLPSFAEIADLRLGTDGTRYGAAGEAVRKQLDQLREEKMDKDAAGSITYGMLSQEVRECLTGGAAAVVGQGAVLAENLANKAVTPEKTSFFRKIRGAIDPSKNLFDGNFQRIYMTGTTGKLALSENENGKLAVIEIQPNTSYSVTLNLHTTLKVGSSSRMLSAGDAIDGGINVSMGTDAYQTVRTTGPNDRYLYVSVTNPATDHLDDSEVYLKVIASDKAVLPAENELYANARYVPNGVDIYSREQVDKIVRSALQSQFLKVRKTGQDFYISIPCAKAERFVRYAFRRVDSDKINMHQWRLLTTDIVDEQDVVLFSLDTQTEWEGAVLEENASDFIGGYHGNEVNQEFSFFLDGRPISANTEDFTCSGREVRILSCSLLNRSGSTDIPLFIRWKAIVWNSIDRLFSVENSWTALRDINISQSKLGMISCRYQDGYGHTLAQFAQKNDDFSSISLSQPFSGFGGKQISRFDLWGQNSDGALSLSVECESADYPKKSQFLSDFREQNRCKAYFDVTGRHQMRKDEKLCSKTKIRVDLAPLSSGE